MVTKRAASSSSSSALGVLGPNDQLVFLGVDVPRRSSRASGAHLRSSLLLVTLRVLARGGRAPAWDQARVSAGRSIGRRRSRKRARGIATGADAGMWAKRTPRANARPSRKRRDVPSPRVWAHRLPQRSPAPGAPFASSSSQPASRSRGGVLTRHHISGRVKAGSRARSKIEKRLDKKAQKSGTSLLAKTFLSSRSTTQSAHCHGAAHNLPPARCGRATHRCARDDAAVLLLLRVEVSKASGRVKKGKTAAANLRPSVPAAIQRLCPQHASQRAKERSSLQMGASFGCHGQVFRESRDARARRVRARIARTRSGRQHRSQGGLGIQSIFASPAPPSDRGAKRGPPPSPRPRRDRPREAPDRRLSGRSARVPRARDRARAVPRRPEVRAARASRLARTSDRPARRWRASRRPRTTGRRRMVRRRRRMRKPARGRGLSLLARTSQPRDGAEGGAGEALRGGGCRALREARGLGGLRSLVLEHRGHLGGTNAHEMGGGSRRGVAQGESDRRVGCDAHRVKEREVVRGRRDRGDGPR